MAADWPIQQGDVIGAPGAATSLTLTGITGERLQGIMAVVGYDATPAIGSKFVLKSGSTVILSIPITQAGPAPISIAGFTCDPNANMVGELSAPGGAVVGYINLSARCLR